MEGEAPVKPGISVSALGQRLEQVLVLWLVHMHLAPDCLQVEAETE